MSRTKMNKIMKFCNMKEESEVFLCLILRITSHAMRVLLPSCEIYREKNIHR